MTTKREAIDENTQGELAKRLRETREYLNLSQQFVAEQTGLPRSAISDIERGIRKVDSLELQRFSHLYRYPVSYFLGADDEIAGADATIQALARAAGELTEEDRAEVLRFATFLRHYASGEPKRKASQ
jgi:transcriptional regulator with XRE-family HTH domain